MRFRAYSRIRVQGRRDATPREIEEVVAEGSCADGVAKFDSKDVRVGKVVFYDGPKADEVVTGSVEVEKAGKLEVAFPETE